MTLLELQNIINKNDPLFQGELLAANALCADYLYQTDKFYDVSYDTGDRSIQCGRHNDVFKLWLMWRSKVCL